MRAVVTPPPRSAPSGIVWPAIPSPREAQIFALALQFEHSQWWPAECLRQAQLMQVERVIRHAQLTVPFYRERLAGLPSAPLTWDDFAALPILTREELRAAGSSIVSTAVPPGHGDRVAMTTSGSSGQPVRVEWTAVVGLIDDALALRGQVWQRLDPAGKLAVLRTIDPAKKRASNPPLPTGSAIRSSSIRSMLRRFPVIRAANTKTSFA